MVSDCKRSEGSSEYEEAAGDWGRNAHEYTSRLVPGNALRHVPGDPECVICISESPSFYSHTGYVPKVEIHKSVLNVDRCSEWSSAYNLQKSASHIWKKNVLSPEAHVSPGCVQSATSGGIPVISLPKPAGGISYGQPLQRNFFESGEQRANCCFMACEKTIFVEPEDVSVRNETESCSEQRPNHLRFNRHLGCINNKHSRSSFRKKLITFRRNARLMNLYNGSRLNDTSLIRVNSNENSVEGREMYGILGFFHDTARRCREFNISADLFWLRMLISSHWTVKWFWQVRIVLNMECTF